MKKDRLTSDKEQDQLTDKKPTSTIQNSVMQSSKEEVGMGARKPKGQRGYNLRHALTDEAWQAIRAEQREKEREQEVEQSVQKSLSR